MPDKITRAQRWLDRVVFLLRHPLRVTVQQIADAGRVRAEGIARYLGRMSLSRLAVDDEPGPATAA